MMGSLDSFKNYMWKNGNMSFDANGAYTIAHDLIMGLHYLHFRKLLHRRISPKHILISSFFNVKYAHFERARQVGDLDCSYSASVNDSLYSSPEAITVYYSYSSDVWSLGSVLGCIFELSNWENTTLFKKTEKIWWEDSEN